MKILTQSLLGWEVQKQRISILLSSASYSAPLWGMLRRRIRHRSRLELLLSIALCIQIEVHDLTVGVICCASRRADIFAGRAAIVRRRMRMRQIRGTVVQARLCGRWSLVARKKKDNPKKKYNQPVPYPLHLLGLVFFVCSILCYFYPFVLHLFERVFVMFLFCWT